MSDHPINYETLTIGSYCITNSNPQECTDAKKISGIDDDTTIFQLQQKIVENLNQINKDYSDFLRCNDDGYQRDSDGNIQTLDDGNNIKKYNPDNTPCVSSGVTADNLRDLITNTNYLITIYKKLLELKGTDSNRGYTQDDYNSNYQTIINKYNDNLKLRNELDMKMNELMQGDKSVSSMYKRNNETMIYTNVVWTVLASSFVYYIFVNLT